MNEVNDVKRLVSHYVYTFGDADGPFNCEEDSHCNTKCWSIYTSKPALRIDLLTGAGTVLCDKHAPDNLIAGSGCMANIAKVCG